MGTKNIINPFVEFPVHAHTVSYMAISNDYQFLFSGCEGGSVIVCNIENVKEGFTLSQTAAELNHKYIAYRHGTDVQEGPKKKREDEKKMIELQKKLDGVGQVGSSSGMISGEFVLVPKAYTLLICNSSSFFSIFFQQFLDFFKNFSLIS